MLYLWDWIKDKQILRSDEWLQISMLDANSESSDSDSIVVPFKNLLNDSYCRDISIKVRSQLDMKRRKGEFIGGYAIYGYCKDERNKNRLVVDEYAADIVRSIYRRKLEGMSVQAIAEQLNSENVLAPSEYKRLCGLNYHSGFKAGTHAKWQAIQVLRILKNEVYTGTMVQGRRQKINYKIKKIRDVEEFSPSRRSPHGERGLKCHTKPGRPDCDGVAPCEGGAD